MKHLENAEDSRPEQDFVPNVDDTKFTRELLPTRQQADAGPLERAYQIANELAKGGHSKVQQRNLVHQWAHSIKAMIKAGKT